MSRAISGGETHPRRYHAHATGRVSGCRLRDNAGMLEDRTAGAN